MQAESIPAGIAEDSILRQQATKSLPIATRAYDSLDFSTALEAVLSISGRANRYLEERAPWTLLKKASIKHRYQAFSQLYTRGVSNRY